MRADSIHIAYDQEVRSYHRAVARLVAKYAPDDAAVLDLGCGVGHVLSQLKPKFGRLRLYAADQDDQCLEITGQRVPLVASVRADIDSTQADAIAAQLGTRFDVVILSHVLEHTLDPLKTLDLVLGLLKEGGHAIIAVPNPVRPLVFLGNAFRRDYVNRGHVYAWDPAHWRNFLRHRQGLSVVEYAADFVPIVPGRMRIRAIEKVEVFLARVLPWWAFSNIAVVRRTA